MPAERASQGADDDAALGLWAIVAVGVGGMVGGGIFAVLGLSVQLTDGAAPIAFALAGTVAALTASSYSRLTVRYPSRGGTITYLNEAFGGGLLSGGLNILLWLSYVIMLALYASAFGSYFASTFVGAGAGAWVSHVALSAVVLGLTILNGASAADVGRAEEVIVAVKIAILAVFVVAGLTVVEPARLAPSEWASPVSIVGGGMLIFVAFEGFELIANSAEDTADPARTLPKAFAISVGGVTLLYVLVAVVTVGVLTLPQIRAASDFVLAEAARPRFGQVGFTVIGVAALLSTASAINATLYGATRLTYSVARAGELPAPFAHRLRGGLGEGLVITSAFTLILANTIDLGQISTVGSAGFLIVFAAVNLAQHRLRRSGDSAVLPALGVIGCTIAFVALIYEAASDDLVAVLLVACTVAGAFGAELAFRRWSGRAISSAGVGPARRG